MLFCSSSNFQVLAQCLAHTESQIFFSSAVAKICYSKIYLRNFALKARKMFYSLKRVLSWMSPSNLKRVCVHLHPPTRGVGSFPELQSGVPAQAPFEHHPLLLSSFLYPSYFHSQSKSSLQKGKWFMAKQKWKWNETSKIELANMVG